MPTFEYKLSKVIVKCGYMTPFTYCYPAIPYFNYQEASLISACSIASFICKVPTCTNYARHKELRGFNYTFVSTICT